MRESACPEIECFYCHSPLKEMRGIGGKSYLVCSTCKTGYEINLSEHGAESLLCNHCFSRLRIGYDFMTSAIPICVNPACPGWVSLENLPSVTSYSLQCDGKVIMYYMTRDDNRMSFEKPPVIPQESFTGEVKLNLYSLIRAVHDKGVKNRGLWKMCEKRGAKRKGIWTRI